MDISAQYSQLTFLSWSLFFSSLSLLVLPPPSYFISFEEDHLHVFSLVVVTEGAPIPPCLGNFLDSLWLTTVQDVADPCLEGPHSRLTAYRARMGRNGNWSCPFILFNGC